MKAAALASLCLALTWFSSCATAPKDLVGTGSTPVFYNLQLTIKDGQQSAFAELMTEMVAATKLESGTMVYEWYLGADGKTVHIHELFADSAAYKAHSANFGQKFAARFLPMLDITGLTAYGNSDTEARGLMAKNKPVFFEAIGGFRR